MKLRALLATLVAAAVALSGCLAATTDGEAPSAASVPDAASRLVAHAASGLVPIPASAASLAAKVLDVGVEGGEPTIGVDAQGAIYVTGGGARVYKSTDKGESWKDVSDRSKPRADFDPYLWLDPLTDRVFSAPLYVACTNLMWSDDGGASWGWNPVAGCGLPGHDHQSLVTGPPPEGVTTSGYPNVVYYAYNSFRGDGTRVVRSLDGGKTWSLPDAKVSDGDDCQSALNGAPAVAPDGTVYVPMARCEGLRIGVSKDGGVTWTTKDVDDVGMLGVKPATPLDDTPFTGNPGMHVDEAGNAYALFPGKDGRAYLTHSRDGGETWSRPVGASPPQVNGTVFWSVVAGAEGRVALAYFGTTADTGAWPAPSAHFAPPDTRWNLYLAVTEDALAGDPVFTTLQVNPDDDPVQIGCLWLSGGVNDCRNLADFFDITERNGRAYVVYADGCKACSSDADSRRSDLRVVVVDAGPSLHGGALGPYAGETFAGAKAKAAAAAPAATSIGWRVADAT
ncbi:MAG TPA: sialidase family protein [Candidatus Thermoplasmatota archaeon]|nr:sialidase family protein [Candidatus Thermoplasmatota archaeon]